MYLLKSVIDVEKAFSRCSRNRIPTYGFTEIPVADLKSAVHGSWRTRRAARSPPTKLEARAAAKEGTAVARLLRSFSFSEDIPMNHYGRAHTRRYSCVAS